MQGIKHSVLTLVTKLNYLTQCSMLYSCLLVYSLLIVHYLPCLLHEFCQISYYPAHWYNVLLTFHCHYHCFYHCFYHCCHCFFFLSKRRQLEWQNLNNNCIKDNLIWLNPSLPPPCHFFYYHLIKPSLSLGKGHPF